MVSGNRMAGNIPLRSNDSQKSFNNTLYSGGERTVRSQLASKVKVKKYEKLRYGDKSLMANVSDQDLMKNRMHNASSVGPGAYNLPEILGNGHTPSLSSMRASPKISFGIKNQRK